MAIPTDQPLFVTDVDGNRIAVIVPLEVYERLLDAYEDQADRAAIRQYQADHAAGTLDEIPWEQYKVAAEAREATDAHI